eukprot:122471_1
MSDNKHKDIEFELAYVPENKDAETQDIQFESAAIPNNVVQNQSYFIIRSGDEISLGFQNNKFIPNGKPYQWIGKQTFCNITSYYWRCCLYRKLCRGALVTHLYGDKKSKDDFGQIHSFTPHSNHIDDTWTPSIVEKIVCMQTMKNSLSNTLDPLVTFKSFQRLYPNQSIEHFYKYKQMKSFLHRYIQHIKPNTPKSIKQYFDLLVHTPLGYNWWKQQLNTKQFANKTWEQVEAEFIINHPPIDLKLHPQLQLNENLIKLVEIQNEKSLINLKENFYTSKLISAELPPKFISDLFLTQTNDFDIILQSEHGGFRLSHPLIKCVHVDYTFTIPRVLIPPGYSQIGFILAQLDAPSPRYTDNQYPSAMILSTSKSKETNAAIFTAFKKANVEKYEYTFNNIKQLSSDMERALFTSCTIVFVFALFFFCLFHYMQANFRKLQKLGLFGLIRSDVVFLEMIIIYLYAVFAHPQWVVKFQESRITDIVDVVPYGYKLAIKAFFKYNRYTYRTLFPVEWTNCSARVGLNFTNSSIELFNKQWKKRVGSKPDLITATNTWREIDANATVDFETHIKDPTNPKNFNLKPKWKQNRDEAITKVMKIYNEYCAQHIDDENDTTTLLYHTKHVEQMYKLMKNFQDEINDVLNSVSEFQDLNEPEQELELKELKEDTMDIDEPKNTNKMVFKKYPDRHLFEKYNIHIDAECRLLNDKIKQSDFWSKLISDLKFTKGNNVLTNVSKFPIFDGKFDNTLQGVCIAFCVDKKWHPGMIIEVDGHYVQIFLPNDKHFDRILQTTKKFHIGTVRIL